MGSEGEINHALPPRIRNTHHTEVHGKWGVISYVCNPWELTPVPASFRQGMELFMLAGGGTLGAFLSAGNDGFASRRIISPGRVMCSGQTTAPVQAHTMRH